MATTLIKNGTIISPSGRSAGDVLVDGETIVAVLAPGQAEAIGIAPVREIDADRQVRDPGWRRRAHPHGAPVRRHRRVRHVRDRHDRRRVGWRHHHHRLRRATRRRERDGRPRRMAHQSRRQLRDRLRLPPDHRRRRRGIVEGDDVPRRQRGHHQLQAVHGVSRGVLRRRRPDPAGDAERRRERRGDDDARRERHRHRRAHRPGAGAGRDGSPVPLAHPSRRAGGGGDQPRHPTRQGGGERAALHRAHVGLARRSRRWPRRGTGATTCSPRRVRSTSTCRSRTSSRSRASRVPSGCARHRCGRSTSTTTPTSGRACG